MKILAWYTFVFTIFSMIASITSEDAPKWRLFGILVNIPVIIFMIKYLFY